MKYAIAKDWTPLCPVAFPSLTLVALRLTGLMAVATTAGSSPE